MLCIFICFPENTINFFFVSTDFRTVSTVVKDFKILIAYIRDFYHTIKGNM